jgi:hypothetical protein
MVALVRVIFVKLFRFVEGMSTVSAVYSGLVMKQRSYEKSLSNLHEQ